MLTPQWSPWTYNSLEADERASRLRGLLQPLTDYMLSNLEILAEHSQMSRTHVIRTALRYERARRNVYGR